MGGREYVLLIQEAGSVHRAMIERLNNYFILVCDTRVAYVDDTVGGTRQ
jgi:hypothetical protein